MIVTPSLERQLQNVNPFDQIIVEPLALHCCENLPLTWKLVQLNDTLYSQIYFWQLFLFMIEPNFMIGISSFWKRNLGTTLCWLFKIIESTVFSLVKSL